MLAIPTGIAVGLMFTQLRAAWMDIQETDFRVFYESGRAWLAGTDLYSTTAKYPNLNPPHFIVAFVPFSVLPIRTALAAWLVLNIACGVAAIALMFQTLEIPRSARNIQIAIATAGLCMGVLVTFQIAQVTGVLMLMMTMAWSRWRRGSWTASAIVLGLLVSVKPFFACLLLIPLLRRRYAALASAIAIGAAATAGGVLLAGRASFERWIETGRLITWFHHPANASLLGLLARVGLRSWPLWALLVVLALIVSVVAVAGSPSVDVDWAAFGVLSILISPLGWDYYLPVVAAPIVGVAFARRAVAWAAIGFIWPIPLLIAFLPLTSWSIASFGSAQAWSLIALWISLVAAPRPATSTASERWPQLSPAS